MKHDTDDDFASMLADLRDLRSEGPRGGGAFAKLRSALSRTDRLSVGDVIGQFYTVEKVLSPSLFLVHHHRVDRHFALRLLGGGEDPTKAQAFEDAALAASSVGHENIVYVTHFAESERLGRYFVMEYLEGPSLAELLASETVFALPDVLELALHVGSALSATHAIGLTHGDVRPARLRRCASGWKLHPFGPRTADPSRVDARYVAPEFLRDDTLTPASDQFALAATVWHAISGQSPWPNRTFGNVETTLPEPLQGLDIASRALQRALAPKPAERFESIDGFLAALQRAAGRPHIATIPPMDIEQASQQSTGAKATNVEVGAEFRGVEREETSPSIEIQLDELPNLRMRITMAFRTGSRLRREWRRNIIGGGVFVPTGRRLQEGSPVVLVLRHGPTSAEISLPAHVAAAVSEPTRGLAIEVAAALHPVLHDFVAEQNIDGLSPQALVSLRRAPTEVDELSMDERFAATLLTEPTSIGQLRVKLANLPVDVDAIVLRLEDLRIARVEGSGPRRSSSRHAVMPPEEVAELAIARARYFRDQGNYLAEHATLELAAEMCTDAELWYRLAINKIQFRNDFDGASRALDEAVKLAPERDQYSRARRELQAFL